MVSRIISYLQDYKYQIIETWITEVDLVPPEACEIERGELPIIYIEQIFDEVIRLIQNKPNTPVHLPKLRDYIDVTFSCNTEFPESLACLEIMIAGQKAFVSVLGSDWDTTDEFSTEERAIYANWIYKTLAFIMHGEIKSCQSCKTDSDCPFNAVRRGECSDSQAFTYPRILPNFPNIPRNHNFN